MDHSVKKAKSSRNGKSSTCSSDFSLLFQWVPTDQDELGGISFESADFESEDEPISSQPSTAAPSPAPSQRYVWHDECSASCRQPCFQFRLLRMSVLSVS